MLINNTIFLGSKTKTRRVTTNPSCGGNSCPALKQTLSCSQYNNRDCVMSSWTSWSLCSNGCGNGLSTRTRSIVTSALCRGKACGTRSDKKQCTDYRENRDCVVSCQRCKSQKINRVWNISIDKLNTRRINRSENSKFLYQIPTLLSGGVGAKQLKNRLT